MSATKTKPAERVTKKKLTLTEAVQQWKAARRAIDEAKPLLEEAAAVILPHMQEKKLSRYRGIGLTYSSARLIIDQAKVREYLGPRLQEFQRRTKPRPSLTLLEPPDKA